MLDETKRPLPSFEKWLEEHTPGTRSPDFAEFADLMRRTQQQSFDGLKPHEASFLRMWQGALMAAVELCNMEALQYKRSNGEIIATLPRVFAAATMYAMASVCKKETPFRTIARIVTEEYRAAAKTSADMLSGEKWAGDGGHDT